MTRICCPYCGATPEEGFDRLDDDIIPYEDDDHIFHSYKCPKCKKKSIRCYEYYAWENTKGDEIDDYFDRVVKKNAKPVRR